MSGENSTSRRVVVALALCLFCSGRAFCQHVSAGIIGGGALTRDFVPLDVPSTPYREYSTSKDYIVGAMLAVFIPANFSLEADALYRPMNFTGTAALSNGTVTNTSPATVITWEFPILLQYRFKPYALPLSPLLEIGPSFRASGNVNGTSPSTHGVTAGAGVQAHLWRLKIEPQLRYTRWAADGAHYSFAPSTKRDQIELLVSLSF